MVGRESPVKIPASFVGACVPVLALLRRDMGTGTSDELQKAFFYPRMTGFIFKCIIFYLGNPPSTNQQIGAEFCFLHAMIAWAKSSAWVPAKVVVWCHGWVASTTRSCVVDSSGEGRKNREEENQRGDGREEGSALWMEGRCDHLVKWCRLFCAYVQSNRSFYIYIMNCSVIYNLHKYMYVYESFNLYYYNTITPLFSNNQ